ncbi:Required for respiratory growth protein 9 mitochondrial [Coemansia interrupta]|uniref:Required for respiratory growth protein 9, mitochondrial n=1 Tax=Coemansia interrupta TaxID=1126814 RepID=A0A9W8LGB8_9FUNG|nr:Required for respiratory growth protein 9 mitochondrial [Coemansia interrupta]
MATKTVLHRISQEKPEAGKSWTAKGDDTGKARVRKSPRLTNQNRTGSPQQNDSGSGFVKIGSDSDRRNHRTDTADHGAAISLTEKTQKAKEKWQRSDEAKKRMQERLKDSSLEGWQRRKIELKLKLGDSAWEPAKKIAVSSMEKIRLLNSEFPDVWTMKRLSDQFKVSQETIRRILKSKFRPTAAQIEKRELKRKENMSKFKRSDRDGRSRSGETRVPKNAKQSSV